MSDTPKPVPANTPPEADPLIGRELADRYRIESLLARGGMARVYRAHDTRLERDVALKILSPPYSDDEGYAVHFLEEARAAASISHPSLVHVYDSGSGDGAHFIAMELLDKHRSLRQELDSRGGRLPRDQVLRIGQELLAGLRAVHERGLVHCDVKPANVMLGPGPAKLIDFGIARSPETATDGDTTIGSLHFMSPEQLHGEPLTPASDLFSLGVVLYQSLTGRVPYDGETPEELSAAHAAGGVRPPSTLADGISGKLDAAILQSLRTDPEQRFGSADAMSAALRAGGSAGTDDTTVVRRVVAAPGTAPTRAGDRGGYVPPPVEAPPPPTLLPPPSRPAPRARYAPAPRRRSPGVWSGLGTFAVLLAAALVVLLIVLPLLNFEGLPGGLPGVGGTPEPAGTPAPGMVLVPDVVGLEADKAIEVAREAGLDWTLYCNHDESQPKEVIRQEPSAGTEVARGAAFAMYYTRIDPCENGNGNGNGNGRGNEGRGGGD